MSIKTFTLIAAVAAGTLAFNDRANAQIGYSTSSSFYSPGVVTASYYTPATTWSYYTSPAYYTTPYASGYYTSPYYGSSYYSTPYYGGYYGSYSGGLYTGYGPRWGWRRW